MKTPIATLTIFVAICAGSPLFSSTTLSPEEIRSHFGEATEAIFGIGIRLQVLLQNPNAATENFVVSPLSAAMTIGQLMMGARGKFREDLHNLMLLSKTDLHNALINYYGARKNVSYVLPYSRLHLQLGSLMRTLNRKGGSDGCTLNSSNALFYSKDLKLQGEFLHNLAIYDTDVKGLDFKNDANGSWNVINDWGNRSTNGLIPLMLSTPLPPTTSAIFANAIYFLAEWETPFSSELNMEGPFYGSSEKKLTVTYMTGLFENLPYAENDEKKFKVVGLPYKNREATMFLILPNENNPLKYNITEFATGLKPKVILNEIDNMKTHSVAVQLPKITTSSSLNILKPLQKYAAYRNYSQFHPTTGKDTLDVLDKKIETFLSFSAKELPDIILAGAAEGQALRVSDLMQEVTFSVNEKGTEAAAITSSIIDYMGGSKNFKVERPFVFFIRHEATSAILFWGTIVNPQPTH